MTQRTATLCPHCSYNGVVPEFTFCPSCQFPLALIAQKYRLERKLGEGGFSNVYLAHHIGLDEHTERVIKVIKPDVMRIDGVAQRFRREVQVTSRLSRSCDHIVEIYDDFGQMPRLGFYYVMEYLEGSPLSDLLQDPSTLPPIDWCISIFAQLCDAIQEAHSANVLHRDLKPANLFVTTHKGNPNFLKVLDFGIAKVMQDYTPATPAITKGIVGTPLYASPEQFLDQPVTERSDIYSMGVLLYEMLAGKVPFQPKPNSSDNLVTLILAHTEEAPPPMHELNPSREVPKALEAVVHKALAKHPEERYPNALAFKEALLTVAKDLQLENSHWQPPKPKPLPLAAPLPFFEQTADKIAEPSIHPVQFPGKSDESHSPHRPLTPPSAKELPQPKKGKFQFYGGQATPIFQQDPNQTPAKSAIVQIQSTDAREAPTPSTLNPQPHPPLATAETHSADSLEESWSIETEPPRSSGAPKIFIVLVALGIGAIAWWQFSPKQQPPTRRTVASVTPSKDTPKPRPRVTPEQVTSPEDAGEDADDENETEDELESLEKKGKQHAPQHRLTVKKHRRIQVRKRIVRRRYKRKPRRIRAKPVRRQPQPKRVTKKKEGLNVKRTAPPKKRKVKVPAFQIPRCPIPQGGFSWFRLATLPKQTRLQVLDNPGMELFKKKPGGYCLWFDSSGIRIRIQAPSYHPCVLNLNRRSKRTLRITLRKRTSSPKQPCVQ